VTIPIRRELRVAAELPALLRSPIFREPLPASRPGLPVLLITGVYANDATMRPMAVWLRRMGYAPKRAGLRFNADCSEAEMGRLELRLERAVERTGRPAAIVGWSRGGLFARALAVRRPDLVAGIVTLGSPLLNPLGYVHPALHLALEATSTLGDRGVPGLLSHGCADEWALDGAVDPNPMSRALIARTRRLLADGQRCCERFWRDVRAPFPKEVGFVSVYSKTDAIVNWLACLDPAARHLEVDASHCGMGVSKHVYTVLAAELERVADAQRPMPGEQALAA
jgi:pimeloyl-ACP methyl ester carboxylesterase